MVKCTKHEKKLHNRLKGANDKVVQLKKLLKGLTLEITDNIVEVEKALEELGQEINTDEVGVVAEETANYYVELVTPDIIKDVIKDVKLKECSGEDWVKEKITSRVQSYVSRHLWKTYHPNLKFGDSVPCDADDCWYRSNHDRLGEYNRSYQLCYCCEVLFTRCDICSTSCSEDVEYDLVCRIVKDAMEYIK